MQVSLELGSASPIGWSPNGLSDLRDARRVIEGIEQALLGETAEWSTRRTFGRVA